MADPIYINNDMIATLKELKDSEGLVVTDAVVNITMLSNGGEVDGVTWPLKMTHADGGNYTVNLPKDLVLTSGQRITAKIVAVAGGKQIELMYNTNASHRTF